MAESQILNSTKFGQAERGRHARRLRRGQGDMAGVSAEDAPRPSREDLDKGTRKGHCNGKYCLLTDIK